LRQSKIEESKGVLSIVLTAYEVLKSFNNLKQHYMSSSEYVAQSEARMATVAVKSKNWTVVQPSAEFAGYVFSMASVRV